MNKPLVYCKNCQKFKKIGFKTCTRLNHSLISSDEKYSENVKAGVLKYVEEHSCFELYNRTYKLNEDLDKLVFILRFIEVPKSEILDKPLFKFTRGYCMIHNELAVGFCFTCQRQFCMKHDLHFDHQYILYEELGINVKDENIYHEYNPCTDLNYDDIEKMNKYLMSVSNLADSIQDILYGKGNIINTFSEHISNLSKNHSSEFWKEISSVLEMFATININEEVESFKKLINEDYKNFNTYYLKQISAPKCVCNYLIDKKRLDIVTKHYSTIFNQFALKLHSFDRIKQISKDYLIYKYVYDSAETILTSNQESLIYFLDYDKTKLHKFYVVENTFKRLFLQEGNYISLLKILNVDEILKVDFKHKFSFVNCNFNTLNKDFAYFLTVNDNNLIRLSTEIDKDFIHDVVIKDVDNLIIDTLKENKEMEIPYPKKVTEYKMEKYVKIITTYNTSIEVMIGVDDTIYYLTRINSNNIYVTDYTLQWRLMNVNLSFVNYIPYVKFYIGSWINNDIVDNGVLFTKKAYYRRLNPIQRMNCTYIYANPEAPFTIIVCDKNTIKAIHFMI